MEKSKRVGRVVVCLLAFMLTVLSGSALARLPCSGSRGGVVRCEGDSFVCADGAVSQSKKSCQASEYANVAPGAVVSESGAVANAPVTVASAPEKASYTIISWIINLFILLVVGFVVVLFLVGRWLLRWFRRQRAEAVKA